MTLVFLPVFERLVEFLDEKLFSAGKRNPALSFLLLVAQRIVDLGGGLMVD